MFSLQQFFSRDDEFFALLEAGAEECCASVQALKRIIANGSHPPTLEGLINPRRKEKQISTELTELMARVSVTALDREDVETLANAFYKIPKTLEKFAERYVLAAGELRDVDFSRHVTLLEQATGITLEMLKGLRGGFHMDKISEQNASLQQIEGEADKLILDLLKTEIYSRKHDTVKVIILKDLYELLEKGVDRCRDAGNTITGIVLKNT
jgi:hypothetical protein